MLKIFILVNSVALRMSLLFPILKQMLSSLAGSGVVTKCIICID